MYKSIIEYFADKSASQCGYCRSKNGSYSNGMWGHVMTCQDYQDLIDRGWRRSGRYCYKPTMNKTCCPQYTIKCDATQFQMTKSQKKIIKRFRNYIIKGGDLPKNDFKASSINNDLNSDDDSEAEFSDCEADNIQDDQDKAEKMDVESAEKAKAEKMESKLKLDPKVEVQMGGTDGKTSICPDALDSGSNKMTTTLNANTVNRGMGADPTKPKAKKKKELRKEKAIAKMLAAGKTQADILAKNAAKNEAKTLEELTSLEFPPDSQHKFEIRLVNAQTSDATFSESYIDSFNVYKKYQVKIHKDSPSKCSLGQFKRFLCNSSMIRVPYPGGNGAESRDESRRNSSGTSYFGAFHQQYIIDGRIFAVGVIDILPHCVSSVYLYYDPDFSFLSPGTLTSLFEISFTRKVALKYYYMGYYIHSCPKMRYKAKYHPSWLLCPKTYNWVPVKQALNLLDKSKYAVLNENSSQDSEDQNEDLNLGILFENMSMDFDDYKRLKERFAVVQTSEIEELKEYSELVGGNLAKRMLIYRHSDRSY